MDMGDKKYASLRVGERAAFAKILQKQRSKKLRQRKAEQKQKQKQKQKEKRKQKQKIMYANAEVLSECCSDNLYDKSTY